MKRTLAALAACLLLAGCTITADPIPTNTPPASAPSGKPTTATLSIDSDRDAALTYTDGKDVFTQEVKAGERFAIEFDVAQPQVIAATLVGKGKGTMTCALEVNGETTSESANETTDEAVCLSAQRFGEDYEPKADARKVSLKATGDSDNNWAGWGSANVAGSDPVEGNLTVEANQNGGSVRIVAVAVDDGGVTCEIRIDSKVVVSKNARGKGAIIACAAEVN